jgi:peptidoglycan/xylan/chitin deacetylase (PgdA/CDA1 family)
LRVDPRYAELDPAGELHFAPDLVRAIVETPGQELGTHTFSHLYLRENGITAEDVAADLAAARGLFEERYGVRPTSLVFPRNQCAFIDVVRASGITVWRGNPGPWYYEREDSESHGALVRALKLLDGINPLRRLAAPVSGDMTRASMFLRLGLPQALWRAHLARIRGEFAALGPDEVFHVWFHPHNLGAATAQRLSRLDEVLDLIAERQQRGELRSSTMADLVN